MRLGAAQTHTLNIKWNNIFVQLIRKQETNNKWKELHSITLHCMRYFLATKIYIRNFSNQNLFPRQTIDILYTQIDYIFTKLSYFHWILKLNKNLSVLFYLFEFFSKLIDQKCLECQFKNNFLKKIQGLFSGQLSRILDVRLTADWCMKMYEIFQ